MIKDWRVSPEASISDHRMIRFSLGIDPITLASYRNPRRADWVYILALLKIN
uniref:Lian-aa1 retrotransposon protein n=1 Tax=Triatoma infestans TaxID=30076 RepID=A0A161N1U7_TRIIF